MRLLVVQVAGIGDAIMASTLAQRLVAEHPGAEVVWVCGRNAQPIVALFDGVTETIAVNERALLRGPMLQRAGAIAAVWRRLIAGRFDLALVLHVDPRYRILVAPLFATPKRFLTRKHHGKMIPVPSRFLGDEYARLADDLGHTGPIPRRYGIANLRGKVERSGAKRPAKRVILVPGGARNALRDDQLRRWPVESYARVAGELCNRGVEVVLSGSEQDAWVRPAFSGIPVTDTIGTLSLTEVASLMCDSDLVISHDTGPFHLARAVRAPLIALFGPTNPSQFMSRDDTVTVIWGGADLACRPCYDGREFARCSANVCLSEVTPQQVLDAALRRLDGKSA